ncbi:uncharacterized protein DUF4296 [Gelidibacter sediminis]|uniref:Uncharacterized protein DUF4296 n=1 Tax=Gelidibacter sediminis TaxID=1608710 RepID=A0A4R7Q8A7_9FLAO|nr:DUF4296 domain-containing protein [Gelidibacter sediminis]TDU43139.1 uncharacterized protein DUF4296 [Gelidibacter sediminis]
MKRILYILIVLMVVGCNGIDKPKKPKNLIDKEKMSEIMYDLYILNAAKGVNRKILETNGVVPLEYLYDKYAIDSLQFAQSNTYYAYDPETYTAILARVKKRLEKNKDHYEELNYKELNKQDSINAANRRKKDTLNEQERSFPQ